MLFDERPKSFKYSNEVVAFFFCFSEFIAEEFFTFFEELDKLFVFALQVSDFIHKFFFFIFEVVKTLHGAEYAVSGSSGSSVASIWVSIMIPT